MVRSAEPTARGSKKEGAKRRLRIEGVLLQTIDSCGLKVTIGALATIAGDLINLLNEAIGGPDFFNN